MEIYFHDVEDRFLTLHKEYDMGELIDEFIHQERPWFLVIHEDPGILEVDESIPGDLARHCLKSGGAILFLSGQPIENETAETFERKYDNRIHRLRVSCPSGGYNRKIEARLNRFLQKVKPLNGWDPIPWEYAEPEKWPENLITIYLTLTALEQLNKSGVTSDKYDRVIYAWNGMPEDWKKQVWENAWEEYNLLQKQHKSEWENVGFPLPESHSFDFRIEDASKGLELIKQVLLRKNV
jgi:hypothetical protein